ncbi:hypothetical protein L596_017206 [Steinernema carpocapsae]|uniref:Uncharacterized protein n=1 Tax=Steinernema carpocapsae TaxID=34508 RepID=A0A4U5N1B5_STECR|nr:hypothetical protein L596_017206 [Steinernema carpocapsae]
MLRMATTTRASNEGHSCDKEREANLRLLISYKSWCDDVYESSLMLTLHTSHCVPEVSKQIGAWERGQAVM